MSKCSELVVVVVVRKGGIDLRSRSTYTIELLAVGLLTSHYCAPPPECGPDGVFFPASDSEKASRLGVLGDACERPVASTIRWTVQGSYVATQCGSRKKMYIFFYCV